MPQSLATPVTFVTFVAAVVSTAALAGSPLPDGFVRLTDLAPDIRQDIRYAGTRNFMGHSVPGYERPACILAIPAAEALERVQAHLVARGLSLAVFDCYRPRRAVAAFVRWAKEPTKSGETSTYLPTIARTDVIRLGYVAGRSSHSRGIAVDVTIVRTDNGPPAAPKTVAKNARCNSAEAAADLAGSLDMGTRFDCFDEMSHFAHNQISDEAQRNRALLRRAMKAEGFRSYPREWWHFSIDVPGYETEHDFPVN